MSQPQLLDFVKAMSDPDRLRIIGALSQGPRSARQVAELLHLSFRKTISHLAYLSYIGVVLEQTAARKQDDRYELDSTFLEGLARQQLAGTRPVYAPDPEVNRVLAPSLNADGTISRIPLQPGARRILLNYLINAFEVNKAYTEKEVNNILRRFNPDVAALRRYLVDASLLSRERDGTKYWRQSAKEGREAK